jgi:hypothetical protein
MFLPVIAQAAITHYGWRTAFVVLGFIPLVVGVPLTALFVRERPLAHQNAQISVEVGESVSAAFKSRIFWIIAATVCHCSPIAVFRLRVQRTQLQSSARPGSSGDF